MDYQRFGRQVALPEIGVEGQSKLATAALIVPDGLAEVAAPLWQAAGGASKAGGEGVAESDPPRLGEAAWWCVESARRALGEAPREMPRALRERLGT